MVTGIPEREKRERKEFQEIIAETFPNLQEGREEQLHVKGQEGRL